jgi:hypothetical protein
VGAAPSRWTPAGSGTWQVRGYSNGVKTFKLAETEHPSGPQSLTHTFPAPITAGVVVDFEYDWQWGGDVDWNKPGRPSVGYHSMVVSAALIDGSGNGYQAAVHQGTDNRALMDRLVEVRTVHQGIPSGTPLATGKGYNEAGWKSRGRTSPDLKPVRFTANPSTGRLSVWVDLERNGQMELSAQALDATYRSFTWLVLTASGFRHKEAPGFANITVDGSPAR